MVPGFDRPGSNYPKNESVNQQSVNQPRITTYNPVIQKYHEKTDSIFLTNPIPYHLFIECIRLVWVDECAAENASRGVLQRYGDSWRFEPEEVERGCN